MNEAILIVGHGSRDSAGVQEFLDLGRQLRARWPGRPVEIAFLEFARPTIQEGVDRLVAQGARTIVVLPGVLLGAGHAKNDMASEVRLARERHRVLTIHMGRPLDVDPLLLQLCQLRYQEALRDQPPVAPADTLLLVVGRGSSDPDANSNVAKVARFLQEGYPVGWSAVAFSGVARPALDEALAVCERAGFRRIVVQPYFLFTGVLLQRIQASVAERRQARPDLDILVTPHLQCHPLLLDAFAQRVDEALHGAGLMNCSLCQYRVPIIGHESKLGAPQAAHHHHVEGLHSHVHQLEDPLPLLGDEPHPWASGLRHLLRF